MTKPSATAFESMDVASISAGGRGGGESAGELPRGGRR